MSSDEILDRLLEITVLLEQDMTRSLAAVGLTVSRAHLLWVLRRGGPSTQQVIATELAVSPRNVTGLVDGLEATGFVRRGEHPTDRRATVVALTPHGERTMIEMEVAHARLSRELVTGLSAAKRSALGAGLDVVAERLRSLVGVEHST